MVGSSAEAAAVDAAPGQATHAFSKLPDELLLAVFMQVEYPNRFSRTNKKFHEIASDHLHIARWLEYRYYKSETIWYALLHLVDRSKPILDTLLQRGADCPNWLLYQLMRDAEDRPNGYMYMLRSDPIETVALHATTAMHLYHNWSRLHKTVSVNVGQIRETQLSISSGVAFPHLLRAHRDFYGVSGQIGVTPQLEQNRDAFVTFLKMYGSSVYSRAAAVHHAVVILQAGCDVQWRFETLQRMVDFPSLKIWSVFLPVCKYFLGWTGPNTRLAQLQSAIGLSPDDSERKQAFDPTVARYLLHLNEVGLYRYGYAALDVRPHDPKRRRDGRDIMLAWRTFLSTAGRLTHVKDMIARLLLSYKGPKLTEESHNFQACFLKYIHIQQSSSHKYNPPVQVSLVSSFEDCSLFLESRAEIDALWLVLHVKNKISTVQGRDPAFIQSRITFDSVICLLSYPWLSSAELRVALKLVRQRFKGATTILRRALARVMRNAFCGMHLVKLAGKLDNPTLEIERFIAHNTLDAILLYP